MDPQLVEKIVHEVKSQGVFDEFRKDSMADVDTKPAYQNLRQRVESAVKKFLSEQRWSPDMNKNQLRERLRRHIANSGFLDVGVERIVDQVVNPKIGSVFQPRIEEIAYKYLGISWPPPQMKYELPPPLIHHQFPPLPLGAPPPLKVEMPSASLLPTDLEQVSPDSDRATVKSECKDDEMDIEERIDDDDESPPFEPLIKRSSPIKRENDSHDSDIELEAAQTNRQTEQDNKDAVVATNTSKNVNEPLHIDTETQDTSVSVNTGEPDSEKEASRSLDAVVSQESQLSQVSSTSGLSAISPDFSDSTTAHRKQQSLENAAVNISEEAQMPKFSENSSETFNDQNVSQLHFDIKKDEIKFEGTERKPNLPPTSNEEHVAYGDTNASNADTLSIKKEEELKKEADESFELTEQRNTNTNAAAAAATATAITANTTNDSSFGSSLEDTLSSAQLCISEKLKNEPSNNTTQTGQKSYNETSNNEPISAIPIPMSTTHEKREKHESSSMRHTTASSSTSRHSKHAKDKYRSHEKSASKDRQRDRSRDRHSKSKHSSSSSKHSNSSSSKRSSSTSEQKRSVTSTKHAISSSSCSSSSRFEANENKRENGNTDRVNSASKKNGRKSAGNGTSATANDDHFELKEKIQRKKSTDSNDEDKNYSSNINTTAGHNSTAKEGNSTSSNNKTNNKSKNYTSDGKYSKNAVNELQNVVISSDANNRQQQLQPVEESEQTQEQEEQPHRNKVVILNDLLENPTTKSIELETNTHIVNHVQIVTNPSAITNLTTSLQPTKLPQVDAESKEQATKETIRVKSDELLFFEEISNTHMKERLNLLNSVMERCRKIVDNLRSSGEMELFGNKHVTSEDKQLQCTNNECNGANETKATLLVDCIRYRYSSTSSGGAEQNHYDSMHITASEGTPPKRFKYNEINCETKTSPASSDASVNSKENEVFDKNTVGTKKSAFTEKQRSDSVNKLSQQRYASEDLYKPRPLSQRSKRRGLDSII